MYDNDVHTLGVGSFTTVTNNNNEDGGDGDGVVIDMRVICVRIGALRFQVSIGQSLMEVIDLTNASAKRSSPCNKKKETKKKKKEKKSYETS